MFRERIAHWARILDLLPTTINAVAVLARVKPASVPTRNYRSEMNVARIDNDPRREMAIAYTQMSRVNR